MNLGMLYLIQYFTSKNLAYSGDTEKGIIEVFPESSTMEK